MLEGLFDDLRRHPGFAFLAIGAIVVTIIWMVYRYYRDEEQTKVMYASMDLDYQTLECIQKLWRGDP